MKKASANTESTTSVTAAALIAAIAPGDRFDDGAVTGINEGALEVLEVLEVREDGDVDVDANVGMEVEVEVAVGLGRSVLCQFNCINGAKSVYCDGDS